jgi:hypothetical protein
MFVRFREMKAQRYDKRGHRWSGGERECAGNCKERRRVYPRWGEGVYVKGRTFVEGCPLRPICPLKKPHHRLEVSIVETRRENGKVRQHHVASLGSYDLNGGLRQRNDFWADCEDRLGRLANRIGPDIDRLRQAIAARIPPLTDDDRTAMDTAAWDQLEGYWGEMGESRIEQAQDSEKEAVALRSDAAMTEALGKLVKQVRADGDMEAWHTLNMLYGSSILGSRLRGLRELVEQGIVDIEKDSLRAFLEAMARV